MEYIELVIKIPEEKYQGIINRAEEILDESTFCSPRYLYLAVLDGTPLTEWLNSFNTESATKCFEAVNILKERLEDEDSD